MKTTPRTSPRHPEPLTWEVRQAQKAASRRAQWEQIARGEKTPEEINRENSAFSEEWIKSLKFDFRPTGDLF